MPIVLDLKKGEIRDLPGSHGLWTARWSPDGAWISALSADSRQLKLYDCRTALWQDLTVMRNIDHPHWTADSAYIYFRGVIGVLGDKDYSRGVYRIAVRTRKLEKVADLEQFEVPAFEWFGITPEGTPLGLRGEVVENIYAIGVP